MTNKYGHLAVSTKRFQFVCWSMPTAGTAIETIDPMRSDRNPLLIHYLYYTKLKLVKMQLHFRIHSNGLMTVFSSPPPPSRFESPKNQVEIFDLCPIENDSISFLSNINFLRTLAVCVCVVFFNLFFQYTSKQLRYSANYFLMIPNDDEWSD